MRRVVFRYTLRPMKTNVVLSALTLLGTLNAWAVHDREIGERHEFSRIPVGSRLKFNSKLAFEGHTSSFESLYSHLNLDVGDQRSSFSDTITCRMSYPLEPAERYALREGNFSQLLGSEDAAEFELVAEPHRSGHLVFTEWRSVTNPSRTLNLHCTATTTANLDRSAVEAIMDWRGDRHPISRPLNIGDFRAVFSDVPYILIDSSVDLGDYIN